MQIDARPVDLRLTTPFRISRRVQNVASNAIVQINCNGYTGYGEAAPDEFYGENVETVLACISQFAGNLGDDLNPRDRTCDVDLPGHEPTDRECVERSQGPPTNGLEHRSKMGLCPT